MAKRKYVVELQAGVWLAPWDGDPGRTLKIENAKKFSYKQNALKALLKAKTQNPERTFKHCCVRLVDVDTSEATAILRSVIVSVCPHRGDARSNPQGNDIYCLDCGEKLE